MSPHIGEKIRETRQIRGTSLRQLAGQVGIHFSHLSKVENGKDTIGRETLLRISEELGAEADLMLGEAGHAAMPFRVVGDIAAGVPMEAIEDVETFDLTRVFDPCSHFLLRVRGDSMIQDGINDGDLAVIRHTRIANSGDTVAAVVNGEATLKRFRRNKHTVVLIPANDALQSMKYPARDVEIRGVLVGVVRTRVR